MTAIELNQICFCSEAHVTKKITNNECVPPHGTLELSCKGVDMETCVQG